MSTQAMWSLTLYTAMHVSLLDLFSVILTTISIWQCVKHAVEGRR